MGSALGGVEGSDVCAGCVWCHPLLGAGILRRLPIRASLHRNGGPHDPR